MHGGCAPEWANFQVIPPTPFVDPTKVSSVMECVVIELHNEIESMM